MTRVISNICFIALAALTLLSNNSVAQSCPPDIGSGQLCTARDFTVSGVVINGPDECTSGDVISLSVRVGLESTAKQRYDVGIFSGENGEPVIGGASCSFDSLAPLEPFPPFNANSGSGGYRNLDGDQCGDVDTTDGIVYKDIQLDSVLCADNDGNGQLDISGLVTWSSNANQDVCNDPDNPQNFFPVQKSKCQQDPDLNFPIVVEPAPSMSLDKFAFPANLPAPGGPVEFFVDIFNTSSATDVLTVTSLVDDIHGDLNGRGTCSVPQTIVPGGFYLCAFQAEVTGSSGYVETDTVVASAVDDDGERLTASDTATVTIDDLPASITVEKNALPVQVREPGGPVLFTVTIGNNSDTESVVITSLIDDVYGDLSGVGTCPDLSMQIRLDPRDIIRCKFVRPVTGQPSDPPHENTVVATALGPSGTPLSDSDSAIVTITDVGAAIEVTKYADPHQLPEPGGTFEFTLRVQNTSPVDAVTLTSLADDVYGDLNGQGDCALPQPDLGPGAVYECTFPGDFFGPPGGFQVDVITVEASDDDGGMEVDFDAAQVDIIDVPSSIAVLKSASPTQAESGDVITYALAITNTSAVDDVTISSIQDDIYGDATVQAGAVLATTCSVTQFLQPDETYSCEFQARVIGAVGTIVTDVVLATGVDNNSLIAVASDDASVEIVSSGLPDATISVTKVAVPRTIAEKDAPAPVLYSVLVRNLSTGDLTVVSFLDDIYDIHGDDPSKIAVNSAVNCPSTFDLDAGDSRLCVFTGPVDGLVGDVVTDTVTVQACPRLGCSGSPLELSDSASVSIVANPASIVVLKTAVPTAVLAPGEPVTFSVDVINNSQIATIDIDQLQDDIYGDVTITSGDIDATNCSLPQTITAGNSYSCEFTATVEGFAGQQVTNIVTATGDDGAGDLVEGSDTATVEVLGAPPRVSLRKTASPRLVAAPGGDVTFSVRVQNTSASESLTLTTLTDDIYGDLNGMGTCSLPQTLAAAAVYNCEFVGDVSATETSLHADTIILEATDESGDSLYDQDSAFVVILVRDVAEAMDIPVASVWWLLGTSVLLSLLGIGALRRSKQIS
ncbi:MAG: hypothetical protein ABJ056_11045 [Halioglobus sp.]